MASYELNENFVDHCKSRVLKQRWHAFRLHIRTWRDSRNRCTHHWPVSLYSVERNQNLWLYSQSRLVRASGSHPPWDTLQELSALLESKTGIGIIKSTTSINYAVARNCDSDTQLIGDCGNFIAWSSQVYITAVTFSMLHKASRPQACQGISLVHYDLEQLLSESTHSHVNVKVKANTR